MFTGIVEIVGTVGKLEQLDTTASGGGGTSLLITGAETILDDCHDGDSISVNGTCLTVTEFDKSTFKVGVAPETLRRTNLGTLVEGSKVNLERAVSSHTRMGGHFVQGHVDTVATIVSVTPDGNALAFRFHPKDPSILRYVVEKGYVAIDGASLTVTNVSDGKDGWWEVMLIAYTQDRIVTAGKKAGEEVNIEVDMVGKYVEKNVAAYFEEGAGTNSVIARLVERVVEEKLKARGREA